MTTANAVILGGVSSSGPTPSSVRCSSRSRSCRSSCSASAERRLVIVFVALPVICYFATGRSTPVARIRPQIYKIYAPALAFTTIVAGSVVFANIERRRRGRLLQARAQRHAERAPRRARRDVEWHRPRDPQPARGDSSRGDADRRAPDRSRAGRAARRAHPTHRDAGIAHHRELALVRARREQRSVRRKRRWSASSPTRSSCARKRLTEHGVALTVDRCPPRSRRRVPPRPAVAGARELARQRVRRGRDGTPSAGSNIEVKCDDDRLEIAVTDSGPGIPATCDARSSSRSSRRRRPIAAPASASACHAGSSKHITARSSSTPTSPHTRFVMRIPRTQPRDAVGT